MQFHENKRNVEFQVGLFAILGIIILVLSYSWFTGWLEAKKYTEIKVFFRHVPMLEKGSPVTILGLSKGKIASFEMKENGVVLNLLVELDFPLREGTQFSVVEANIMGDVAVDIVPGKREAFLDLNEIQQGEENFTIANMIRQFSTIGKKIEGLLTSFDSAGTWADSISTFIHSAHELVRTLQHSVSEEKIKTIIEDGAFISSEWKKITKNNTDSIQHTVQSAEKSVELLQTNLQTLQTSLNQVNVLTNEMVNNDSDFRQFISQRELYDQLLRTTQRLDSLLIDVKKNPKRYFQLKVF